MRRWRTWSREKIVDDGGGGEGEMMERVDWKRVFIHRNRRDAEINGIVRDITVAKSTLERLSLEERIESYGYVKGREHFH